MKGGKKLTVFHSVIESQEDFVQKIIEDCPKKLKIVDVHLEWCGPCKPMEHNYKAMWFQTEEPEGRIAFFQCDESLIPEEYKLNKECTLIPMFAIYKGGECKKVVHGARLNEIQDQVSFHLPELEE